MKKASWKTTLGGILQTIGLPMTQMSGEFWPHLGVAIAAIGSLLLGLSARDNNVTSHEAGAE